MKKIFIACDTSKIATIKKIIKYSKSEEIDVGYKIGLEFFYSPKGRKFISKIKNNSIFLDLKLNDIPNTCISAIKSLKDLRNINYLTVHINGGYDMLKQIKSSAKKINKNLKILGVTVLTSLNNHSIKKTGHTRSIKNLVILQAKLAKNAGLDGIICSGHEVPLIKKICKKMEIITPGIRMAKDGVQDQKRIMTPTMAFKSGATGLVIGRSITQGNIKNNILRLVKSLT
jgi:orotidine-5'-phosphate decarboxylase